MGKITEYPESTSMTNSDKFFINQGNELKQIKYKDAMKNINNKIQDIEIGFLEFYPEAFDTFTGSVECETDTDGGARIEHIQGYSNQEEGIPTPANPIPIKSSGTLIDGKYYIVIDEHNEDNTQSKQINIPISKPLYEGDYIEKVGGVYKEYHKMAEVDLGSLDFNYVSGTNSRFVCSSLLPVAKDIDNDVFANAYCTNYIVDTANNIYKHVEDKTINVSNSSVWIYDTAYTDATTFKTAMQGVKLVYELAEPTLTDCIDQSSFYQLETYKGKTFIESDANINFMIGKNDTVTTALNGERLGNLANIRSDDIDNSIKAINSNLDTLEFGEVAGGKNILDITQNYKRYSNGVLSVSGNKVTITGEWYCYYIIDVEENTDYFISGNVDSYTVSNNCAIYNEDVSTQIANHCLNKTFNSGNNTKIAVLFYSSDCYKSGTTVYSNIQIEKGTVATEYEPYIPSVKMIADEVSAQNESLADYGLVNKFDGIWKQGYYQNSDGAYASSSTAICNVNKISVASGNVVKFKTKNIYKYLILNFFTSNDTWINSFRVENLSEVTATAPTNASYARISIFDNVNISPSQNIVAKVYVNNAIDELKNDLSDNSHLILGFDKDGQYYENHNCRMYFDGTNLFVQTSSGGNLLKISGATLLV